MSWRPSRFRAAILRGSDAAARAIVFLSARATTPFVAGGLVLLFLVIFFVNGALGVDFGSHWDEWYHVQVVGSCIQRMSLLPDGLSYGGPYFSLGFPVVIAHQWKNLLAILGEMKTQPPRVDPIAFPSVARFKAEAMALIGTSQYVLEVRTVFLSVTVLSIVWAYLAALRSMPRRRGAALAGAAFLAFSWELGYHARWLAIDTPLTQFCALELFLFCAAWRAPSDERVMRWYCGAAAAAGAVFACKLTGLFAILPIGLLPLVRRSSWSWRKRLVMVGLGGLLFFLVSFALSPAFYLDPLHLLNVFRSGSADYNSTTPSYPFYVGVAEHALRMLMWYFASVPSPFLAIAFVFSGIALVGLASLLRRDTRMTLSWLTFMVAFIGVFTHNHLLIVRQYLMCTPFLALSFARGTAVVWDFLRLRDRRLAALFVAAVTAGFMVNAAFEARMAWHVTRDTAATVDDDAARDLLADRRPVRMTHTVFDRLRTRLGTAYTCGPANVGDKTVSHFIGLNSDYEWMTNRLGSFTKVYGGSEVNTDYYASWNGRGRFYRLVDVPVDTVVKLHRNMAVDVDCFPAASKPTAGPKK